MKKFLYYFFASLALIVIILYSLLCSSFFFKNITVKFINSFTPVNLQVENWEFKPWRSLKADGLHISDISSKDGGTNFFLSADSLNLYYKASSFFSDTPEFSLVEIDGIKIIARKTKPITNKEKKKKKAGKTKNKTSHKKPPFSKLPFIIKKFVVRNCDFYFADSKNISFGIKNFGLAALDIAAGSEGTALASGALFYYDGKNVSIDSLPFACDISYKFGATVIPDFFSSALLASNLFGRAGKFDLAPFTTELSIKSSKNNNKLYIDKFLLEGYWNGNKISTLSVTGKIDIAKNIINISPTIKISSNDFFQAVIAAHQKFDIRESDAVGFFNVSANIPQKKYALNGKFAVNKVKAKKSGELPPMNFAGAFNLAFDNKTKQLDLNKINFIVKDAAHPMLQLKTEAPVVLKLGSKFSEKIDTNEVAKINLIINKVKLKYFNDFIKNKKIRFNAGNISGKINCNIVGAGNNISADNLIVADNIDFSLKKARWQNCNVKISLNGKLDKLQNFTISAFNTKFFVNKRAAGEIAAGGIYNLKSKKERIAVAATDLAGALFHPLLDAKGKNKNIDELLLNFKILTSRPENAKTKNISATFSVIDTSRLSDDELEKISLNFDINQTEEKIYFNKCELLVLPGKWDDNNLKLSGEFFIDKSNRESDLTLHAKHFDATAILDEFLPIEKAKPKTKSKKKKPPRKKQKTKRKEKNEPLPAKLQFVNLNFKTHIDEFIARDLVISPLSFDFIMKNNKMMFVTKNVLINDGPFDLNIQADMNYTGYYYTTKMNVSEIPLKPIFDTFAPKLSDALVGKLDGTLQFEGKGFSRKNLYKFFKGKSSILIKDGHLGDVPVLKTMAKMLKIKELSDYSFSKCTINAVSFNGTNFINDMNVEGKTIKMGLNGFTTFKEDLNLDVYLALSGKVIADIFSRQDKFKIPFTGALDTFYKLPMPIKIGGKFRKPKMQSNVKEFIPMLVKTIGADAMSLLGNIFSKDKKKSKKAKEDGLKLLQNLFEEVKEKQQPPSRPPQQRQQEKQYNLPHRVK